MDDNKNNKRAIVLTIIAIATMVVVLVGATFAYLASVTTKKQTANVSATTEGGDSIFMISAGKDINVSVTVDNFGEENGSVYDYSAGKITLMGSSTNRVDYSVNLYIGENDFEYSSGTCYDKPSITDASVEHTTKTACDGASGYLWVEDACYDLDKLKSANYTNSLLCTTNDKAWVTKEVAELVIDLYKSDNDKTCAVADSGVCVDNASGRSVVSSITTQSECTGTDKEWLSNINDNGICYSWVASKDITTLEATEDENGIELYYDAANTYVLVKKDTNNEDSDYYYAKVTMRNLSHNQIINGKKTFNGKIVYLNKSVK